MKLRTNEAAFEPFRGHLMFHKLSAEGRLVALGDEVIFDAEQAEAKRQRLLRTVQHCLLDIRRRCPFSTGASVYWPSREARRQPSRASGRRRYWLASGRLVTRMFSPS